MKEKRWLNSNKMLFESKHKTFNKQVSCISTGNVLGGCQLSSFIRGKKNIRCNNQTFKEGELQSWDLNKGIGKCLPYFVKDWIGENVNEEDSVICYLFRYFVSGKEKQIGVVITDKNHNFVREWNLMNTEKSQSVLDEAKKYICN